MLHTRARWVATCALLVTAAAAAAQPEPPAPPGAAPAPVGAPQPPPSASIERPVPTGPPGDPHLDEARALADRGYELFIQGDYVEAIALFVQAEKLSHSPVILSFIAQSYEALGKLIEARDHYAQIVAEDLGASAPEDFLKAQRRARRQLPLLVRRIPRLLLRVSGARGERITVQLDGRTLQRRDKSVEVNPGRRTLRFERKHQPPVVRVFTATERQLSEIEVVFSTREVEVPVTPPQDVARWLLPATAFAVSFAGSAVSIVTLAVYFDRAASLKERCPENRCPPELEPERDTLTAIGTASMVSFGIGAGAAAAGTLLVFFGPRIDRAPNNVRLELAPFVLRGTF